jgi:hypothetical protein
LVTVVNTQWLGSNALELTYTDPRGKVANEQIENLKREIAAYERLREELPAHCRP